MLAATFMSSRPAGAGCAARQPPRSGAASRRNFELPQVFALRRWTGGPPSGAIRRCTRTPPSRPSTPPRRSRARTRPTWSWWTWSCCPATSRCSTRSATRSASATPSGARARPTEAVDLLLTGRCGVLLVDIAAVSSQPSTLVEQIVDQFPDVVVVVAGQREDEPVLRRPDQRRPRLPVHAQAAVAEARGHVPAGGHARATSSAARAGPATT